MPEDRVIYNPLRRERMRFLETAAETGGRRLRVAVTTDGSGAAPLVHFHPHLVETVVVRSGRLGAVVRDRELIIEAGTSMTFSAGVPHTWWNAGQSPLEVEASFEPAGKMQQLLETHYGLVREGQVNARGIPRPLQAAVIAWHFRDSWVPAKVPAPVRAVVLPLLAAIGRLRGYRPSYPEYSIEADKATVGGAVATL